GRFAELGVLDALCDGLARLLGDDRGELVLSLAEKVRVLVDDGRALLDGLVPPAQVALVSGIEDLIDLLIRGVVELLDDFTGGRVLDAVAACSTAYIAHSRLLRLGHLLAPLKQLHTCSPPRST